MKSNKKAIVIGAGFAGISAASFLAKLGWQVTVIEKHNLPGGRARQFSENGFTFDMGPSWYWMPDVFERYFNQFGKQVSDYYKLTRLNPSYRVYWNNNYWDIPADYQALKQLFETVETGAGKKLDKVMDEAAFKYKVGVEKLVFKPGQSITEFFDKDLIVGLFKLDVFNSVKAHIEKHFKNQQIRELLEFPVLFLGALPEKIPALYTLMNYADIKGGTWYPKGGMYQIVEGMYSLAKSLGVNFIFNSNISTIIIENSKATAVQYINNNETHLITADVIISGADYHFTEQLLPIKCRNYSEAYWQKRVMAPSCLLYYVGLNKKLKNVLHHSLFFDVPFKQHAAEIYSNPQWPSEPLFYVSATSVTDSNSAPINSENLFFLIPVAAGLQGDSEELRTQYFDKIVQRFEEKIGEQIKENITYYQSYATANFLEDYNAFKGNAYGLANTLMQTANLKPNCRNKKVKNLFYTGQLTVPGPGVPPSLISGEVVAKLVNKIFGNQ